MEGKTKDLEFNRCQSWVGQRGTLCICDNVGLHTVYRIGATGQND